MIKLMAFVSRLPHVDRAAFRAHYEARHAPLILRLIPSIRSYERNYPDYSKVRPPEGKTADEIVGFDAVAILTFADRDGLDAFKRAMRDPDTLRIIQDDEALFLDGSKSRLYVVEEHVSHLPAAVAG
jgi:EthD domain